MSNFDTELQESINDFTDNRQPFTSWDVRDKLRDLYGLQVRYRETNYATLTFMQHNSRAFEYVAQSIEVLTGETDQATGQPEVANVWQFTPVEVMVKSLKSVDPASKIKTRKGGFFSRLFK
tara:strand:- start:132839 stop:133201 length:363 start_codon:yes stop_codon:yes gene_type:complete